MKLLAVTLALALVAVLGAAGASGQSEEDWVDYGGSSTTSGPSTDHFCMFGPTPSPNAPVPEHVCPRPQVSISASPNPAPRGGYITLSWTTQYAWTCHASGGWSGEKGTNGSQGGIGPLTSTTRFTLTCTGDTSGGDPGPGSAYVDVTVSSPSPPPPPPPPGPPPPSGCTWNAAFVSMGAVPSAVQVNTPFTVPVTFKNTGTCPWTRAQQVRLGSQNPENNGTWNLPFGPPGYPGSRVELGATESVPAQGLKTFNVTARAPATQGPRNFQFRVVLEGRAWLGTPTAGPGNGLSTNVVISVTSGPPAPPPDPLVLQCAVRASAVTTLGNRIQGFFENRCKKLAFRLASHVCLMRQDGLRVRAFACKSQSAFAVPPMISVTANTNRVCNYTTFPYIWYTEGYGSVTFKDPPATFTSPRVKGPGLVFFCN